MCFGEDRTIKQDLVIFSAIRRIGECRVKWYYKICSKILLYLYVYFILFIGLSILRKETASTKPWNNWIKRGHEDFTLFQGYQSVNRLRNSCPELWTLHNKDQLKLEVDKLMRESNPQISDWSPNLCDISQTTCTVLKLHNTTTFFFQHFKELLNSRECAHLRICEC